MRYRATRVVRTQRQGDARPRRSSTARRRKAATAASRRQRAELKPAVEQLLGLPFEHFTKCVVLPQGEFARFLHDDRRSGATCSRGSSTSRSTTRIGQRGAPARRGGEARGRDPRAASEETLDARPQARATARRGALASVALHKALDAARPETTSGAARDRRVRRARAGAAELAAQLETVAVPRAGRRLTADADAATTTARAAAEADGRRRRLAELDDDVGVAARPRRLERRGDAHAERARARRTAPRRAAREGRRTRRDPGCRVAGRATSPTPEPRSTLRDAHAAHALRAHLEAGEPCPVCEREVQSVPKRKRLAAREQAEAALAEAWRIAATHAPHSSSDEPVQGDGRRRAAGDSPSSERVRGEPPGARSRFPTPWLGSRPTSRASPTARRSTRPRGLVNGMRAPTAETATKDVNARATSRRTVSDYRRQRDPLLRRRALLATRPRRDRPRRHLARDAGVVESTAPRAPSEEAWSRRGRRSARAWTDGGGRRPGRRGGRRLGVRFPCQVSPRPR